MRILSFLPVTVIVSLSLFASAAAAVATVASTTLPPLPTSGKYYFSNGPWLDYLQSVNGMAPTTRAGVKSCDTSAWELIPVTDGFKIKHCNSGNFIADGTSADALTMAEYQSTGGTFKWSGSNCVMRTVTPYRYVTWSVSNVPLWTSDVSSCKPFTAEPASDCCKPATTTSISDPDTDDASSTSTSSGATDAPGSARSAKKKWRKRCAKNSRRVNYR